ncbi:hypothetical protein [Deinococcus budaensis]|uniref:Uncharacterized protein n=1 Tax=Deinococcus budaensis TaxID=1665626 RepID=A0A7W8GDZ3_9DEIO|nr:hypothetical protein [Deinococcus budaensis]MBB5233862.1 hypothetical protein [Deinococcus budaensis]
MLRSRRPLTLLAAALLTLPGVAGAQAAPTQPVPAQAALAQAADGAALYRTRNFYFVFKLATTLPLTVQDTPECLGVGAAGTDRQAASSEPPPVSGRLIRYSFVSSLDRAALAEALDAFLREHTFQAAGPPPGEGDRPESAPGAVRTLTDPEAPGFSYTVRLLERSAGASALCVTLRMPPAAPADPASLFSQETS